MAGKFRPGPFATAWKNFVKSLKKEPEGTQVGRDPFGNRYFEIPADPSRGKRRPIRWYDSPETNQKEVIGQNLWGGFDAKMPAEWESWLRQRRDDPPTDEQVMQSLALADMKKRNAARLDAKNKEQLLAAGREVVEEPKPMDHEKPFWPKYEEYEIMAGEKSNRDKDEDKWEDFKNPYAKDSKSSDGPKK